MFASDADKKQIPPPLQGLKKISPLLLGAKRFYPPNIFLTPPVSIKWPLP